MKKIFGKKVRANIALRRRPKAESFVTAGEPKTKRRLAKLKKIGEKLRPGKKRRLKPKKERKQAIKIWEYAFEGSFNQAMKNTAVFIKKRRKTRRGRRYK